MNDIETLRKVARENLPVRQSNWLDHAMNFLRVDFDGIGLTIPKKVCIVVDYPEYSADYNWLGCHCLRWWFCRAQHWIYINPSIDGLTALDILVHELVHVVVTDEPKAHGQKFMNVTEDIGLNNDGPDAAAEKVLLKRLREIQETLGPYPVVFGCLELV